MKVALAGFGQEGKASYEYWKAKGAQVTVADERQAVDGIPDGAEAALGPDAFGRLDDFDLIVRSPSVNPRKLPYGDKVWSATNEFFKECPAQIIGVTGTKGKGTTSSLIVSILRAAGRTVHLVGNIGTPALDELGRISRDDIVVFEISSFQLWDIRRSPRVAVVLGVEPDHLDVHDDMNDYVEAKANIVRFQDEDDLTVYNQQNDIAAHIATLSKARRVGYIDQTVMKAVAGSLMIPGPHNVENAAAAVAAVADYVTDESVIRTGLQAFTGLPHRIKLIRDKEGVRFYDDSYSSAPAASMAALASFDNPKIIILGGYDKHADFSKLAHYVSQDRVMKKAFLIGQTRHRIAEAFAAAGVSSDIYQTIDSTDFSEIVHQAAAVAEPGDVVLLSPGCASFDMFKNFTDRGEQFTKLVNGL